MILTAKQKRARFCERHRGGCFILPSPWDVGSARLLEHVGFEALASANAGFAWTTGHSGSALSRDEVLAHLGALNAAVDLPVSADFESGFAAAPEALAANVRLAIDTGIAGLSIGDGVLTGSGSFDRALAVERVHAARRAIDQSGQGRRPLGTDGDSAVQPMDPWRCAGQPGGVRRGGRGLCQRARRHREGCHLRHGARRHTQISPYPGY
jgi:Phosphoenolpyruvate phosphomutase